AGHDVIAAKRVDLLAIYEDGSHRLFEGARQADPDVRVLALSRPVDHAAHRRHAQLLDAGVVLPPDRHLVAKVVLDVAGHLLEEGGGGASAARACADLRREAAQPHRLQHLLGYLDLLGPVAAGSRGEADPDRGANAALQKDREAGGARDDAATAPPGLVRPPVRRVVAPDRVAVVGFDQVLAAGRRWRRG